MIVYAESSAVIAWLLGEGSRESVLATLRGAERIVTSVLTLLESRRALARAEREDHIDPAGRLAATALLDGAARGWIMMEMSGRAIDRATLPFPHEPVRTLDAIHLATAIEFQRSLGIRITVLSLDARIRANAEQLGMPLAG